MVFSFITSLSVSTLTTTIILRKSFDPTFLLPDYPEDKVYLVSPRVTPLLTLE